MAKMKFRVMEGKHHTTDAEGNEYTFFKGDVIETDKELDKIFVNKFQRVGGGPVEPDAVTDPKSRKVAGEGKPAPAAKANESEESSDTSESKSGPELSASPLGDDVTDTFDGVADDGFKVFKGKGGYFVTEAEEPTKALNEKALKKGEVLGFVAEKK